MAFSLTEKVVKNIVQNNPTCNLDHFAIRLTNISTKVEINNALLPLDDVVLDANIHLPERHGVL